MNVSDFYPKKFFSFLIVSLTIICTISYFFLKSRYKKKREKLEKIKKIFKDICRRISD